MDDPAMVPRLIHRRNPIFGICANRAAPGLRGATAPGWRAVKPDPETADTEGVHDRAYQRRVPLTVAEHQALLDRLREGPSRAASRRSEVRLGFGIADVPIAIEQPEGGTSRFLAYGRNFSEHGVSLLHGGFVYPGSRCHVGVRRREGGPIMISGTIRHCRLVAGSFHEIGIRFDEPVDPGSILGVDAPLPGEARTVASPWPTLQGRVLLADGWAPSSAILERRLTMLGLDVQVVAASGPAIDAVRRGGFDLVLGTLDPQREHGSVAIARMRSFAPGLPILWLPDDPDPARALALLKAGATRVIPRPIGFDLLLALLQSHLGALAPLDRIDSTAGSVPEVAPLIPGFVARVKREASGLLAEGDAADPEALRILALRLRAHGIDYGYRDLATAALALLAALDDGQGIPEARAALLSACGAIAVPGGAEASFRAA